MVSLAVGDVRAQVSYAAGERTKVCRGFLRERDEYHLPNCWFSLALSFSAAFTAEVFMGNVGVVRLV